MKRLSSKSNGVISETGLRHFLCVQGDLNRDLQIVKGIF